MGDIPKDHIGYHMSQHIDMSDAYGTRPFQQLSWVRVQQQTGIHVLSVATPRTKSNYSKFLGNVIFCHI